MIRPVQITFRNMRPSATVATRIRAEATKLDKYYGRITSCRVVVKAPHRHHRRGGPFHLRIDLCVPSEEIVINHTPSLRRAAAVEETGSSKRLESNVTNKDLSAIIRDAFNVARRRLEDHARRLRGDVKMHARVSPVRADKLRAEFVTGV